MIKKKNLGGRGAPGPQGPLDPQVYPVHKTAGMCFLAEIYTITDSILRRMEGFWTKEHFEGFMQGTFGFKVW